MISRRFLAIIDDIRARTSMSQSELERRCGMSKVVSNVRKGKVKPSVETIARLLTEFPAYSPDWLLLGNGEMLRSGGEVARLKRENEQLMRLNIALQERLNGNEDS